jgi:hypothetical protein
VETGKATMTIMIEDRRRLSGNFLYSGRGIPYKEGNFSFSTFLERVQDKSDQQRIK